MEILLEKWQKVPVKVDGLETTLEFFCFDKGEYFFYAPQCGLIATQKDKNGNFFANSNIVDNDFVKREHGVEL